MIRVRFFASLREALGLSELDIDAPVESLTVGSLLGELRCRGEDWEAALGVDNILCAVNHEQADPEHRIAAGDEIAFYPPVTGG
jgi:molybdopterin synthase sulfur carrier subunit